MILSDDVVEKFYATLYDLNAFKHDCEYALKSLLIIESIEKQLKNVEVEDSITEFKLDNLNMLIKSRKDFYRLVVNCKRKELDMLMCLIVSFIFMIFSFYMFSGLFN